MNRKLLHGAIYGKQEHTLIYGVICVVKDTAAQIALDGQGTVSLKEEVPTCRIPH
jgi:hypothetical protein